MRQNCKHRGMGWGGQCIQQERKERRGKIFDFGHQKNRQLREVGGRRVFDHRSRTQIVLMMCERTTSVSWQGDREDT